MLSGIAAFIIGGFLIVVAIAWVAGMAKEAGPVIGVVITLAIGFGLANHLRDREEGKRDKPKDYDNLPY